MGLFISMVHCLTTRVFFFFGWIDKFVGGFVVVRFYLWLGPLLARRQETERDTVVVHIAASVCETRMQCELPESKIRGSGPYNAITLQYIVAPMSSCSVARSSTSPSPKRVGTCYTFSSHPAHSLTL